MRYFALATLLVLSLQVGAYSPANSQVGESKKSHKALCGLIKSAYFKKESYPSQLSAVLTLVSNNRVVKVLSEPLTLSFLAQVNAVKATNVIGRLKVGERWTWSSTNMNDYNQLCLDEAIVVPDSDSNELGFVSTYKSYQFNIY